MLFGFDFQAVVPDGKVSTQTDVLGLRNIFVNTWNILGNNFHSVFAFFDSQSAFTLRLEGVMPHFVIIDAFCYTCSVL